MRLIESATGLGVWDAHEHPGVDPRDLAWVAGFVDTLNSKLARRSAGAGHGMTR